MIPIYGVTNKENIHTDTSNTLHGAKCYATRNGFKNVSMRIGYSAILLEYRDASGKWNEYKN